MDDAVVLANPKLTLDEVIGLTENVLVGADELDVTKKPENVED